MSIRIKNITSGEVIKVNNVQNMNGMLVAEKANPQPRHKFYEKYTFLSDSGDNELLSFIHDLRQAIKVANIVKCVSYRQTALLSNPALVKFGRAKALRRNVFKGMEADEIRIIYGYMNDTNNIWAQAMKELFEA